MNGQNLYASFSFKNSIQMRMKLDMHPCIEMWTVGRCKYWMMWCFKDILYIFRNQIKTYTRHITHTKNVTIFCSIHWVIKPYRCQEYRKYLKYEFSSLCKLYKYFLYYQELILQLIWDTITIRHVICYLK